MPWAWNQHLGLTVATRWVPQTSGTHVPHWSSDAHRWGPQIFIRMAPTPSWKQNPPVCRARAPAATGGLLAPQLVENKLTRK